MNKKITWLALCLFAASSNLQATAATAVRTANAVTLSVGVGVTHMNQANIINETADDSEYSVYPPSKNANSVSKNSFAAFNGNFTQPKPADLNNGSGNQQAAIFNWYTGKNTKENPLLPGLDNLTPFTTANIFTQTQTTLLQSANYKEISTYSPKVDYGTVSNLNGATGIDVKGQIGYKTFLMGGLFLRATVAFGYLNTKSTGDVGTGANKNSFFVDSVLLDKSAFSPAASEDVPMYYIEPQTTSQFVVGNNIREAFTYQAQWYWNIAGHMGYQVTENFGVEAFVGFQQTRCKLSISTVTQESEGLSTTYTGASDASTMGDAIPLGEDAEVLNIAQYLGAGMDQEELGLMLPGVLVGAGMNFKIAENLTMGCSYSTVFNGKRTYAFDGVAVSQAGKLGGAAPAANQATNQAGQQAPAQTTVEATDVDPATQDVSMKIGPSFNTFAINLTYEITTGSSC